MGNEDAEIFHPNEMRFVFCAWAKEKNFVSARLLRMGWTRKQTVNAEVPAVRRLLE